MNVRPLRRSDGVLVERLDDGLVIYDTETNQAHGLDPVASSVWAESDGRRTVAEVATAAELEEAAVVAALDQLAACGLLAGPAMVSRRKMLRRTAAVGAVIAAVPIIETVVIPTAAAHASTGHDSPDNSGNNGNILD